MVMRYYEDAQIDVQLHVLTLNSKLSAACIAHVFQHIVYNRCVTQDLLSYDEPSE